MKLIIEHVAAEKIRQYTKLCPDEISGLGKVTSNNKGDLLISDVEIFKQTVSGAHSTIDPVALAQFQSEIVKAGGSMKDYKLWWHSHAHMSVFFSKTDTDTIDSSTEFPWLVSLVVNKKGEAKARLDVYTPLHIFADLDVEVEKFPENEKTEAIQKMIEDFQEELLKESKKGIEHIEDLCQKEIDSKVGKSWKEHKHTGTTNYPYGGGWFQDRDWEVDLRTDYWKEKNKILNQIEYLAKKGRSKEALKLRKQEELAEHLEYGFRMGYEVRLPITSGN